MRRVAVAALFTISLVAGSAIAEEVDGGATEADSLLARIDADAQRLQTEDCTIACSALQSMMRATDRLCSIEPEVRCRSARDKVKGAVERVRTFCPECVPSSIGAAETPTAKPAAPPEMSPVEQGQPGKRGGCAGCATASSDDGATSALGFALLGLMIAMRRRLRRGR